MEEGGVGEDRGRRGGGFEKDKDQSYNGQKQRGKLLLYMGSDDDDDGDKVDPIVK